MSLTALSIGKYRLAYQPTLASPVRSTLAGLLRRRWRVTARDHHVADQGPPQTGEPEVQEAAQAFRSSAVMGGGGGPPSGRWSRRGGPGGHRRWRRWPAPART